MGLVLSNNMLFIAKSSQTDRKRIAHYIKCQLTWPQYQTRVQNIRSMKEFP